MMSPSKKQRVTFDEEIITEHDKERGTRMVITEPDTPFARSPLLSEDESPYEDYSPRKEEFKQKRKAHYNEFKVLKKSSSPSDSDKDEKVD
jgi:Protein phosphatase inhibitor 2 (IPP-2)